MPAWQIQQCIWGPALGVPRGVWSFMLYVELHAVCGCSVSAHPSMMPLRAWQSSCCVAIDLLHCQASQHVPLATCSVKNAPPRLAMLVLVDATEQMRQSLARAAAWFPAAWFPGPGAEGARECPWQAQATGNSASRYLCHFAVQALVHT